MEREQTSRLWSRDHLCDPREGHFLFEIDFPHVEIAELHLAVSSTLQAFSSELQLPLTGQAGSCYRPSGHLASARVREDQ